jgi:hypothetical protein
MQNRWLFGWLIILLLVGNLWAQDFGTNKVQYQNKNWEYIQSEHFDLYYYQGGRHLAEFAADIAESAYVQLSHTFNYKLVDRVPIIIYRSHNDFSETNLSGQVVEESVGGFTEFLKNRVVLPFEGDYEMFRHVIHHELTHAVQMQFLYGSGPGAIIQGATKMMPPTWFIEGQAEFQSLGWDTDSDMFVRDATLRGYLPPIQYLQAFLAYKGGQSLWLYIDETFGAQKRTELLQRIKGTRNFERAWRSALNESLDETSEKWQRWMRKKYWPEIADRKEPTDYAQRLTDHKKWGNFINNSPAISPTGDRIAFLTDRSGYFDIYVVSATNPKKVTKLVSGQRKSNLEELHWLRPGMSWSPDGKSIAFAARAGGEDALNILDVDKKEIKESFKFGLDGLFSPAWSPATNEIAFVGLKNCCSNIYVYNLDSKELRKVTNDIFSDLEPTWSPDGKDIAFVSDRKENVEPEELRQPIKIQQYDYHSKDIYIVHADGSGLRRVTTSPFNETSPQWTPDGQKLLYVSDKSGIANIYDQDMATGEEYAITNLLTGCAQLSWGLKSNRLAFTAFLNGGYDIYVWPDPLSSLTQPVQPQPTAYILELQRGEHIADVSETHVETETITRQVRSDEDFSHFVFDDNFKRGNVEGVKRPSKTVFLTPDKYKEPSGEYKTNKYRTKFSIDYVGANAGYDPINGVVGLTQLYLSDELGDQQIQIGLNLIQSLSNSDFLLAYQYLKHRINWSAAAFQFVDFYSTNFGIVRFTNRGAALGTSYPFSRFRRVDLGLQYINLNQENLSYQLPTLSTSLLMPMISYTSDNSLWGYFAPGNGNRNFVGISASPKLGADGKQFVTGNFDFRHYVFLNRDYSLAMRITGGASFGKNPTLFILGGVDNWLNYHFYNRININSIQDYFLSDFLAPLRGADLYQLVGTRAALMNIEFRFPFIKYFVGSFPLPLGFQNIMGNAFVDAGSAWTKDSAWKFVDRKPDGSRYVRDVVTGFGYGIRAYLFGIVLRFDAAWQTDFNRVTSPRYYWSLGLDF